MTSRPTAAVLAAALLLGTVSAWADEILDEIDAAIQAYKEQDYRGALEGLRFATAKIQKRLDEAHRKLLPEPLPGWSADPPEVQSAAMALMGGGTTLKRAYSKDGATVEIEIVANSPMIAMMSAALQNPALLAGDGAEPYRFKRLRGIRKVQGEETEISLLMGGQVLITLRGRGLPDDGALKAYLNALDLPALREAFL